MVTTSEGRLAWVSVLIACLYFGWLYLVLARHTSTLVGAFEGLGAVSTALTFTVTLLVQAVTDHSREMLFRPLLDIMQKLS